jgi:hypothetical protein
MVQMDPHNAVSHNSAVYKNVTTTTNEYLPYFYVNMWRVIYYMKDTVYDWLFVRVIRGIWRKTLASTHHLYHVEMEKNTGEIKRSK